MKVIEDDTTLVHKALSGSDQAFTHIFERYAESLWTQACGQCENFDDAHDLVQETFVRAFNRLHMLREPHKLSAWLRAILRRLAINQYERRRARQSHLENRNTIDIPGSAAKPFVDPESALMSHEIGEQIERALNFLTEKSRQVFIAFHLEGHSLEEVARLHNLSVGAVKNRLFHSRQQLQKDLNMTAQEQFKVSQMPEKLSIFLAGQEAHEDARLHPRRLTQHLLSRRLLFACRKAPKSITELAKYLNVDRAYVEDIVPDLVAGEVLKEAASGTYLANFLYVTQDELDTLLNSVATADHALPILKEVLPELEDVVSNTEMVREQGFDWAYLSWIVLPVWIFMAGLTRQVDRLPTWGRHRIMVYPVRPVDFWHIWGAADAEDVPPHESGSTTSESDVRGFGKTRGIYTPGERVELIRYAHQERYIGRLVDGSKTLSELVGDAEHRSREEERLARYVELGYIAKENDRYRLNIPVITAQDEDQILPIVDQISEKLAHGFLDDCLSRFADTLRDLEFDHLLQEPHYIGFYGFVKTADELVRACVKDKLLKLPQNLGKGFGAWAWWDAPKLMRGWSRGR